MHVTQIKCKWFSSRWICFVMCTTCHIYIFIFTWNIAEHIYLNDEMHKFVRPHLSGKLFEIHSARIEFKSPSCSETLYNVPSVYATKKVNYFKWSFTCFVSKLKSLPQTHIHTHTSESKTLVLHAFEKFVLLNNLQTIELKCETRNKNRKLPRKRK